MQDQPQADLNEKWKQTASALDGTTMIIGDTSKARTIIHLHAIWEDSYNKCTSQRSEFEHKYPELYMN